MFGQRGRRKWGLCWALLVLLASHCGHDDSPPVATDASALLGDGGFSDGSALPGYVSPNPAPQALFGFVAVGVLEARCQFPACHHGGEQPAAGLDLTTDPHAALLGRSAAVDRPLVTPGDPDDSYLMEKLTGDPPAAGERMPPGPALDPDQLGLVRRWIEAGAPP